MSFLNELAGGKSSNGEVSILDIAPKNFTQTSAFYVGNASLIRELETEICKPVNDFINCSQKRGPP